MSSFTFRDKPVTSRIGICLCAIAIALGMLALPFLLLIALAAHPIFRFFGRRGCIRNGGEQIIFDKTSFERS